MMEEEEGLTNRTYRTEDRRSGLKDKIDNLNFGIIGTDEGDQTR